MSESSSYPGLVHCGKHGVNVLHRSTILILRQKHFSELVEHITSIIEVKRRFCVRECPSIIRIIPPGIIRRLFKIKINELGHLVGKFKNQIIEAATEARSLLLSVWSVDQLPYVMESRCKVLMLLPGEPERDAFGCHSALRFERWGDVSLDTTQAHECKVAGGDHDL